MPTAVKFHYLFNLRDLSNVFQGLLFSTNECINTPTDIVRLWAHETQRVYLDKLADGKDIDVFEKMQKDYMKKSFDDIPESEAKRKPLIYRHFAKYVIKYRLHKVSPPPPLGFHIYLVWMQNSN